jgi:hypothetical protein
LSRDKESAVEERRAEERSVTAEERRVALEEKVVSME